MKKLLFSASVIMVTFLIYYFNINNKIYYLSLGDYLAYGINNRNMVDNSYSINIKNACKNNLKNYVNYSTIDDYRVMDLINDINYNKTVLFEGKEYKLQNLLIKSNLITLSIGMNDLIYKKDVDYNYADNLINDISNLFMLIRKYNKDKIYYLGFYDIINNNDVINYINKRVEKICKKNKIIYIDISGLSKYFNNSLYPSNDGYSYIIDKVNFTK